MAEQADRQAVGGRLELAIGHPALAVHQRDLHMAQVPGGPGAADFAAMVRLIDRRDTSWRE